MCVPDLFVRNIVDPHQQLRLIGPAGEIAIEQSDHEGRTPGIRVDTVGDGVNLETGKHILGNFSMSFCNPVDEATQVHSQHGHVQFLCPGELLEQAYRELCWQNLLHQGVGEAVMSGGNRCVGCEHALVRYLPDAERIDAVRGAAEGQPGIVQQLQRQQTSVPFVHMIFFDRKV